MPEASTKRRSLTTDTYSCPTTSNRLQTITQGAATVRQITYDGSGNILTDNRAGATTTYTYNKRNRLASATSGALVWGYTYNSLEQLVTRTLTTGGTDVTHFIHDLAGNVIAESSGTGPASTLREYIWLPGAEIAPTMSSSGAIDRPIAVVEDVETASPLLWYVHVDHLHRPVRMTNGAKATVWNAVWLPWGGVHSITGSGAFNARFPGQWFQLEAGLHYNWHRHYDPTLGRYTQPDPLGFVDGPSVYGYAGGSPLESPDITGESRIRRNQFSRIPGRIQYNPNALDYSQPPRRDPQPFRCEVDATGKVHGSFNRSTVETFRRRDLQEIRENLQQSIATREREQRELGEEGGHRRRIEQERELLRSVEKLIESGG